MINIPKGTKDVLPSDSYKWQYIESCAREVAKLYNVREVRTPAFEYTELFLRSIGEATDVVGKEMYTFLDKGNRSITLKPEGTAPVARAYIENSLEAHSLPVKMFYFTPVFRYERPSAERYREHHQFGVELYGSKSANADGEIISIAHSFLNKLGISDVVLHLSSIGCPNCRAEYNKALRGFLEPYTSNLCPTCNERLQKNPLRTLDCKVENCKKIVEKAPKIIDYICIECANHMDELTSYLKLNKIPYVIDSSIVRGLDYYTKTVFEFISESLVKGTICGGGRYDNLVESIGGKPTPCVGFGIGLERVLLIMENLGIKIEDKTNPDIYIMPQSDGQMQTALKMVKELRDSGFSAETDLMGRSLKAQFRHADKLRAKYAVVIGENEINSNQAEIKNMQDGTCEKIQLEKIVDYLRRK